LQPEPRLCPNRNPGRSPDFLPPAARFLRWGMSSIPRPLDNSDRMGRSDHRRCRPTDGGRSAGATRRRKRGRSANVCPVPGRIDHRLVRCPPSSTTERTGRRGLGNADVAARSASDERCLAGATVVPSADPSHRKSKEEIRCRRTRRRTRGRAGPRRPRARTFPRRCAGRARWGWANS
jgi:hypothetical protein